MISTQSIRADNRRADIVDAAAAAFREFGFNGASMREVAGRVGMLPGSMYYHFESKEDLLLAVYAEGVERISRQVRQEIEGIENPVARLEAAVAAHLEALLDGSDYVQVLVRVLPQDVPGIAASLVELRDQYESVFRDLVDKLDVDSERKRYLRLFIVGACNWAQVWYRSGQATPRQIAAELMNCVRAGL